LGRQGPAGLRIKWSIRNCHFSVTMGGVKQDSRNAVELELARETEKS
jgi:hypothetical protein